MKRLLIVFIIIVFLISGCSKKTVDADYFKSSFDNTNFVELSYKDLVSHYKDLCDITIDDLNLTSTEMSVANAYKDKKLVFAITKSKYSYGKLDDVSFGANLVYINLLSEIFGFEPEFITYHSFVDAKLSISNGECDFLFDVFLSQDQLSSFDYSTPISNQTYTLFGESFEHLEKDLHALDGSTIGYKAGKSYDDFKQNLHLLDIDITLKPYKSFEDSFVALQNNEIQYAVGNESFSNRYHNLGIESYYLSNTINCPPTHMVSKKGNHTAFLNIMSKAIDVQLFDIIESYKIYLSKKIKFDNLDFTDEELELIMSQNSIKMYFPVIRDDIDASGTISLYNFIFEVLNEASRLAGIEAKPVYNYQTDKSVENAIADNNITTAIWYLGGNEENIVLTEPFIESKTIITGLDDKEAVDSFSYFEGKRIGVIKNTKISNILKINLQSSYIVDDYYNITQTLDGLKNDEVDFIALTELAYLSLNEQGKDYSLINVFETEIYQDIAFAFYDTKEGRLYASIYSKLLTLIDVDYIKSQHLDYYISMQNLQEKSNQRVLLIFIITLGLSLIIILLIALALIDNNRKVLEKQATIDFLTGLKNRYAFDLDCKQALDYDDTVLFIDLNKFKQINDLYGHHFGDLVLTNFAKSLSVFDTEQVYRMSGDEFIVITKNLDMKNIESYISKIEISVLDHSTNNNVGVRVSAGIIAPGVISSKEHAVIISDYAMYENKKSEKTKYTYVDKAKYSEIEQYYKLESQFLDDLAAKKLYCEYQPIVDINTDKIIGIEALTRWNNNGKPVAPPIFLSIADKLNIIHDIDLNCFREVKKLYKYLKDNALDDGKLIFSINLTQDSLLTIADILVDDDEIPKNRVQLEVVESVTLDRETFDTIISLNSVGYNIAIDDYGSGQSSIPIIECDVFKTIKLDKSLLELKDLGQSLIPNLYEMFSVIGKNVIIEGIETEKHMDFVRKVGIEYVQGYYYYKPMPKHNIVELIKKQK